VQASADLGIARAAHTPAAAGCGCGWQYNRAGRITSTHNERNNGDEFNPKARYGSPSTALGRGNRGRLALVDGALFVWFREIPVGPGWYSLQGCGRDALAHAVSAVRPALLAQGFPRLTGIAQSHKTGRSSRPFQRFSPLPTPMRFKFPRQPMRAQGAIHDIRCVIERTRAVDLDTHSASSEWFSAGDAGPRWDGASIAWVGGGIAFYRYNLNLLK
jgi:hypothetical protein